MQYVCKLLFWDLSYTIRLEGLLLLLNQHFSLIERLKPYIFSTAEITYQLLFSKKISQQLQSGNEIRILKSGDFV